MTRSAILGIQWCAGRASVDVISLSLGSDVPSDGLDGLSQAVDAAVAGQGQDRRRCRGQRRRPSRDDHLTRLGGPGDHGRGDGGLVLDRPASTARRAPSSPGSRAAGRPWTTGSKPDIVAPGREHRRGRSPSSTSDYVDGERDVDGDAVTYRGSPRCSGRSSRPGPRRTCAPTSKARPSTSVRPARTTSGEPVCSTAMRPSPQPPAGPGRRRSPRTSTSPARSPTRACRTRPSPWRRGPRGADRGDDHDRRRPPSAPSTSDPSAA